MVIKFLHDKFKNDKFYLLMTFITFIYICIENSYTI